MSPEDIKRYGFEMGNSLGNGFRPYEEGYLRCTRCMGFLPRHKAKEVNGRYYCPVCGCPLRFKPRGRRLHKNNGLGTVVV